MMKIGVWIPQRYETSVKIYTDNIVRQLKASGNELIFFSRKDDIPAVDLIWDSTCTGAQYPNRMLLRSHIPWVVTVHGAAILSTPLSYNFLTFKDKIKGFFIGLRRRIAWLIYRYKVAQVITVSEYAKEELISCLHLQREKVSVIAHGYDPNIFFPQDAGKNYLLHISVYQPKKNVDRIIQAYQSIHSDEKLPLIVVCPGYDKVISDKNITLISTPIIAEQVARYMMGAYTFIFPSLHESFGMPLLEAMACGVPVITSNTTACPEIIQHAGLLVDPLSVASIASALEKIMEDKSLHKKLSDSAIERAKSFSWEKAALQHEELFKKVIVSNAVN